MSETQASINDMDKFVKFTITVGALLTCIGVFYLYVVFLPGVERGKAASAEREQQVVEASEAKRQERFEACFAVAYRNYSANWAATCKGIAKARATEYRSCLKRNKFVIANQLLRAEFCKGIHGEIDPSPACRLPQALATSIDVTNTLEWDKCTTEAWPGSGPRPLERAVNSNVSRDNEP